MADHIRALFIVEGEKGEPALIEKLFATFLPADATFECYSYNTNLHDLAEHIEAYYPDLDDYVDVLAILHEKKPTKQRKTSCQRQTPISSTSSTSNPKITPCTLTPSPNSLTI